MHRLATAFLACLVAAGLMLQAGPGRSPTAHAQAPFSVLGFLSPVETVVAYYAALDAREFDAAYAMLSAAAQAESPFSDWAGGYLTTQRIDVQAYSGADPGSVYVELWVSDDTIPHVHGYSGTWTLVRDAPDQPWYLDAAQIVAAPPPAFPFTPRPVAHCSPQNPDPAAVVECAYKLNVAIPAGATVTVTSIGPQPLGGPVDVDCTSVTGGLTCAPPTGLPMALSVRLRCAPLGPACSADASFTIGARSLNGGLLSQAVTIATVADGTSPTFLVVPDPQVTFTTLVPLPPVPAPQ